QDAEGTYGRPGMARASEVCVAQIRQRATAFLTYAAPAGDHGDIAEDAPALLAERRRLDGDGGIDDAALAIGDEHADRGITNLRRDDQQTPIAAGHACFQRRQ